MESISSTSKLSVAPRGISGGEPRSPYAADAGHTTCAFSPFFIFCSASVQQGTTPTQRELHGLTTLGEPPRDSRRLHFLRGWSHEHIEEVFPGGPGTAVRLVFEHEAEHGSQWAAIGSIAAKIGCTPETLRRWVRQAERDRGRRAGADERRSVSGSRSWSARIAS